VGGGKVGRADETVGRAKRSHRGAASAVPAVAPAVAPALRPRSIVKPFARPLTLIALTGALFAGAVLLRVHLSREDDPSPVTGTEDGEAGIDLQARFESLEARERAADETYWAAELLADEHGRTIESLWDSINASTNKLGTLAGFSVGEVVLGDWSQVQDLTRGIRLRRSTSARAPLPAEAWPGFVGGFARTGWVLEQIEFRHEHFNTRTAAGPARSRLAFSAHLLNAARDERATLEGDLMVDWAEHQAEAPAPSRVDASRLVLKTRQGKVPFLSRLVEPIQPPAKTTQIDPLILQDLDGDGLSEIILAAKNLIYRRNRAGQYQPDVFCRHPVEPIQTGLIADFDGDGRADFLGAGFRGLYLFKGPASGAFESEPRLVWEARPQLRDAQVLTCADVDRDGDLDVFLGQYKTPYDRGQMPTPYYDANDGDPAYLLLNDGRGNLSDATVAAGLAGKRTRRSYSGSLADLTGDGIPDLVVISDFAGIDLYRNVGRGHFEDLTAAWIPDPRAFGMSHSIADFNRDGLPDVLMIGMNSPVVRRLESMNLWREDGSGDPRVRAGMSAGNRLYLAVPGGGFTSPASGLVDSIARSGWSWGCSSFDFDNDGFVDVYVGNGHETGSSVRDYEREFWMHDIHVGGSTNDIVVGTYFQAKSTRTRGRGESYGGHEKNRLFLNQGGEVFVEAGYLAGVALPEDTRNVVTDDLDGDGRLDLVLTTSESWPVPRRTLRVFENAMEHPGHWIGFRFQEGGSGTSPVGVEVTLQYSGGRQIRQIVNGDSYRSQHAARAHFGLGAAGSVERVEIRWPGGATRSLTNPGLNQYHLVNHPGSPE